jgi:hypothetical protein
MVTPASSSPKFQDLPKVQEEVERPEESNHPVARTQTSSAQAEFESLERAYYETVGRTNQYPDGARAQLENAIAWDRLSDFAEKHPETRWILPRNPCAPKTNDCSIS